MRTPNEIAATLSHLEKTGNPAEGVRLLASANLEEAALAQVLSSAFAFGAHVVCWGTIQRLLLNSRHPVILCIHFALAEMMEQYDLAREKLAEMPRALTSGHDEAWRMGMFNWFEPAFSRAVIRAARRDDWDMVRLAGDFAKACAPFARDIFDAGKTDWGDASVDLLELLPPRPPEERTPRSVLIAMRARLFPDPASRRLDEGRRIGHAMREYGWRPHFIDLTLFKDEDKDEDKDENENENEDEDEEPLRTELEQVVAACESDGAMVIDAEALQDVIDLPDFLRGLRRRRAELKVVLLYFDPWEATTWGKVAAAAAHCDAVWSPYPSLPVWDEPVFQGRMIFNFWPIAGKLIPPERKLAPPMTFIGSITPVNWYRAFWMETCRRSGIEAEFSMLTLKEDDIDPLDSFGRYMRRMADTGVALNLSMRKGGARKFTGRTMEALFAGTLLVLEHSEDTDRFLVPWEHYVPFRTIGDLEDIAKTLRDEPERFEPIRQAGHRFVCERYGDEAVIGHLDRFLFG